MISLARDFFTVDNEPQKINDKIVLDITSKFEFQNKILLFGEVQSGKTNNIINIIINLFDQDKIDYVFYVTGNTTELKLQNFNRLNDTLPIRGIEMVDASTGYFNSEFDKDILESRFVFTVLKQYFPLVKDFVKKNLTNKRILIIDDEADDYSNSETNAIYIREMIDDGVSLISCTATPFTNLILSEDIYDSYYQLSPWPGYHGRKSFGENYRLVNENDDEVKINLLALLLWAKKTYELELEDSQLLFNSDDITNAHQNDNQKVIELIEEIKHNKEKHVEFFNNETNEDIDINKVIDILENVKMKGNIKQLNSKSTIRLDNKGHEIIFGGILLSRGITYENLLVEVYRNFGQKSTAHTLVQRSRWFGYRKNLKNDMVIFIESKVAEAYNEINKIYDITLKHNINSDVKYKEKVDGIKKELRRVII